MRHLKLTLEFDVPRTRLSDATRTSRVAINLLRNVAAQLTGTLTVRVDGCDLPLDHYMHSRDPASLREVVG